MNLIVSRVYIYFIAPKFIKKKKKKDPFFRIAKKKVNVFFLDRKKVDGETCF